MRHFGHTADSCYPAGRWLYEGTEMALPWLSIVVRSVPWAELVRRAPQIIAASSQLLDKRNATAGQRAAIIPDEADEIELERRISSLEEQDAEHARVFEQLAKQTQDLSVGLQVLAARLRLLTFAFAAVLVLGVLAAVYFW
jgi:uncharacterized coiled-coil protein SlyX